MNHRWFIALDTGAYSVQTQCPVVFLLLADTFLNCFSGLKVSFTKRKTAWIKTPEMKNHNLPFFLVQVVSMENILRAAGESFTQQYCSGHLMKWEARLSGTAVCRSEKNIFMRETYGGLSAKSDRSRAERE